MARLVLQGSVDPVSIATIELVDMLAQGTPSERLMRIYALMDLIANKEPSDLLVHAASVREQQPAEYDACYA